MSKYDGFATYLESLDVNKITISFSEFEKIISNKLPPTARKHRAWWANAISGNAHSWASIWLDEGWEVIHIDIKDESVVFSRAAVDTSKRFWWVNQNQTYDFEVPGGFMWSPKVKTNGGRNQFYVNMRLAKPGDLVFSFCDTYIKAIGVVTEPAKSAPQPNLGKSGANWSEEGWFVEVEFREVSNKIRPKDYIEVLKNFLPSKYSPLQENGNGLQSVYLAEISKDLASKLMSLIGIKLETEFDSLNLKIHQSEAEADVAEVVINERTDIGPTKKLQLVEARRGQGIFKSNLRLVEDKCRITGVTDIKHLRASHIKPWKNSDDQEKISGSNGLLLAPHLDHLFDRGFISFKDDGELLISESLNASILSSWGINLVQNVGGFSDKQKAFLAYHRLNVFIKDVPN